MKPGRTVFPSRSMIRVLLPARRLISSFVPTFRNLPSLTAAASAMVSEGSTGVDGDDLTVQEDQVRSKLVHKGLVRHLEPKSSLWMRIFNTVAGSERPNKTGESSP